MKKILLIICAFFVVILAAEWFILSNYEPYPYNLQKNSKAMPLAEIISDKPSTLDFSIADDIKERPLFVKGRQPVIEEETPEQVIEDKKAVDFPKIILNSIIIIDDKKRALFKNKREKQSFSLVEGEIYKDWALITILPNKVIFKKRNIEEMLLLRSYPAPKKSTKPARKAPKILTKNKNPFKRALNNNKTRQPNTRRPKTPPRPTGFGPG